MKQTKIPRFESGPPATLTRIPKKASGISRPISSTLGIPKLARPQVYGLTAPSKINPNPNPTIAEAAPFQSNVYPRKTFLRRFGAANKVQLTSMPRLINNNSLKPSHIFPNTVSSSNNVRVVNETMDISNGAAMNATKPVIEPIDASMDRSLTRSNTFVCEQVDDQQAKLLSVTHNISANDTINQTANVQLNKERTFKRSLSPIPGEAMNSAKRKLVQVTAGQKMIPGPLISTPRRSISYSDARKANLTFFGAKSIDFNEPQVNQLQTFSFDNTFEQSNNFAPDATKLGSASSATMQGNRVFDLTQTVQQNDTFYPETRNATHILDANAAERGIKNGDAMKAAMAVNSSGANDVDGNLTKTITGEFGSFILSTSFLFAFCFLSSCYATAKKKKMNGTEHAKPMNNCAFFCCCCLHFSGKNAANPNCWLWSDGRGIVGGEKTLFAWLGAARVYAGLFD